MQSLRERTEQKMEPDAPKGGSKKDSINARLEELPKRIRDKIKISETHFYNGTPCWEWTGSLIKSGNGKGYAQLYIDGFHTYVHIIVYNILVGPIQKGLECDHLCRIIWCVRYDHIEPVSHAENIRRAIPFLRILTHCPHGHKYTEANTYLDRKGVKHCRICGRNNNRRFYYRAIIETWEKKDPRVAKFYKKRLESLERSN